MKNLCQVNFIKEDNNHRIHSSTHFSLTDSDQIANVVQKNY